MNNSFSPDWYSVFLDNIPADKTAQEVAFIARNLPVAKYPRILDLGCGTGRHSIPLANAGYQMVGVDFNAHAADIAKANAPANFEVHHMHYGHLDQLDHEFDGLISMWSSWGYLDDDTNASLLASMGRRVKHGGRLIVDVYNQYGMRQFPLSEVVERAGRRVETTRRWDGPRMHVTMKYEDGHEDHAEWRLYTVSEFAALAHSMNLEPLVTCAWHDEKTEAGAKHARMQFVLAKR